MRGRHELTDPRWVKIAPLRPGRQGERGRAGADNRLFVDAVRDVAKTGIPWRDLPPRLGKWHSV